MKKTSHLNKKKIQEILLGWYAEMGRHDLPWRETNDLYKITVSEIMLQQTNVPKVIEKYKNFLKKFPTVEDLANASQADVLRMWQGLGYNRRALNLHKLAQEIHNKYGGHFPESREILLSLPGIGPYTSAAILAFGRNADVSAVDVNVERFIRRIHGQSKWKLDDKNIEIIASFVPKNQSRDWHSAVMDFASNICTKRQAKCLRCPLSKICASYPDPDDYIRVKKVEIGREECGKHIPRRIYRGRIIEALRKKKGITDDIGREIKKDWGESGDVEWLGEILAILAKEQMIEKKNNHWILKK